MWRWTARFGGVLAGTLALSSAAVPPAPAPAAPRAAAARGVSVEITQLPDRFVAGAAPETVTVVASKAGGGACLKVRWSLVLRLQGLIVEQVRVQRIEEDGAFPVDLDGDDGTARITDERLDPGTLCRDRTVTARYRVNIANDVRDGRVTMLAEAYDAGQRLLESAGATRAVVAASGLAERSAQPSPPGERSSPSPDAGTGEAGLADTDASGAATDQAAAGSNEDGLPLSWFLVGGLMMFLGLSLLLNVRRRHRDEEAVPAPVPAERLSRYRTVPRRARGY